MTNILHNQKYDAEILVVCDPVTRDNITEKLPMKKKHLAHFAKTADENGFKSADFGFINCAPKIPLEIESSKTKVAHFIKEHQQEFLHTCAKYDKKKLILTMGSLAPIQFANKQVQITKVRGQATVYDTVPTPVFHTYAMGYVQAHPGNQMVFEADFKRLASLRDTDYSLKSVILDADLDYQWCTDLTEWIENPPISMAYDTEGTGLEWFKPEIYPFTIQFCRKEGSAVIVPIDKDYYPELDRDHDLILHQVQQIMGNEKIRKAGHNIKYDNHMLREIGINVKGPFIDTQQLVFNIDENIKNKSLDECIRLFVSELSGYADCVAPETLVLTEDMRKVRADSLNVGDVLCAFTYDTPGYRATRRKMSKSVVLGTQKIERECLKITTLSGRTTTVSTGHLMLSKRHDLDKGGGWRWRKADQLRVGSLLKPFPWEDPLDTYDAGYVSGVIDGEGWNCIGASRLGIAQQENEVLDNVRRIFLDVGIYWGHSTDIRKNVNVVNLNFDGHDFFRVLQIFRPKRILAQAKWEGCGLPTNAHPTDPIVSIEKLGVMEVIGLETSTHTIIADGLLSHNSFNKRVDKSKMIEVPYDELKTYGCGDADAVYRLAKTLMPQLKKNPKQYFLFQNVQMPGIMAFADTLEYYGVPIDECQLRALGERLDAEEKELYSKLISEVPGKVKRKHLEDPKHNKKAPEKILAFTRPDLVRDTLFTRDGFNLKPKVFTKGTKRLSDDQKIPSTSGKHHLTHFKEFKTKSGFKFVENFMTYQKLQKMQGTYVGQEGEEETGDGVSGFWKYIHNGIIRPSYFLSSTVTGRSSSRSPNGQNFNKRGPWAKDFLKLFVAPPGYKLISADYSQAELRIAAWEAKEPRMLEAYKNGEDIHAVTGAYLSGLTMDQFNALPESEIDLIRFKAKGCIAEGQLVLTNFGLIPIEKITQQMLVWDGYEYVKHGGLIDKGIQEVIEYQGLIATPDHRVLLENGRWVQLKDAKSRSEKISKGAKGEKPLRVMDSISRDAQENKRLLAYSMPVFSYKTGTMDIEKQFSVWKNKRKSSSQKAGKSSFITRGEVRCVKTALRESEKRVLSKLWRQGDNEQIYSTRFYKLGNGKFTAQRLQGTGNRQNKQRRALSAGEFETSNKNTEFTKQTHQQMDKLQKYKSINKSCVASYKNRLSKFSIFKKENCNTTSRRFYSRPNIKYEKKSRWKRVYDIADCGPKNRFTVSGLIVHNCNFGLLYGSMAKTYMEYTYTSYGVILTLNEAEQHREAFFDLYKGLQPWAEKKLAYVHKHGYIDSLHGARRHLPDINSSDEWIVREAERQAVNSSVQRFGSDLGVIAVTRISRDLKKAEGYIPIEPRMFIHDALVFMVPDYYVECALPAIKWYMENNPLLQWFGLNSPVPIIADIEVGQNLGQLQKRKDVIAQKPDWFTSDLIIV